MKKIPDKVYVFSRLPKKTTDLQGNEITVIPSYVLSTESAAAKKSGETWVEGTHYYGVEKSPFVMPEPEDNFIRHIQIIGLEVRAEGGRAYKVIDEKGRLFDLREDILMDIFTRSDILANGHIEGVFVWGIKGSQTRLTFVNSDEYDELIEEDKKIAERKKISNPEVGKLYAYTKDDVVLLLDLGDEKPKYFKISLSEYSGDFYYMQVMNTKKPSLYEPRTDTKLPDKKKLVELAEKMVQLAEKNCKAYVSSFRYSSNNSEYEDYLQTALKIRNAVDKLELP